MLSTSWYAFRQSFKKAAPWRRSQGANCYIWRRHSSPVATLNVSPWSSSSTTAAQKEHTRESFAQHHLRTLFSPRKEAWGLWAYQAILRAPAGLRLLSSVLALQSHLGELHFTALSFVNTCSGTPELLLPLSSEMFAATFQVDLIFFLAASALAQSNWARRLLAAGIKAELLQLQMRWENHMPGWVPRALMCFPNRGKLHPNQTREIPSVFVCSRAEPAHNSGGWPCGWLGLGSAGSSPSSLWGDPLRDSWVSEWALSDCKQLMCCWADFPVFLCVKSALPGYTCWPTAVWLKLGCQPHHPEVVEALSEFPPFEF